MKILHSEASLGWGGQEIRILTESKGMIELGHQVSIAAPAHAPIFKRAADMSIPTVDLPIDRKRPINLLSVINWLKQHQYNVINTHSSTDSWLFGLASLFVSNPAPIVRTRHISAPINNNMFSRWLYTKSAQHIVTTGERLRQQLISENRFPASQITSIPTGIDNSIFTPGEQNIARKALGLPVDKRIIGIIATIRSWKGHIYLASAFAKYHHSINPNSLLLIVGDGPARAPLEEEIERSGISDAVLFAGNQTSVTPWLQALDYFVLPSYANEGVPQAMLQAMHCRKPIITTDVGSICDAVQHEKSALIVSPKSADEISAAIDRLDQDAELRESIASNAYNIANSEFTLSNMLNKMEHIFSTST